MNILNIKIFGRKWQNEMYMLAHFNEQNNNTSIFILYKINLNQSKIHTIGATQTQNENLVKLKHQQCIQIWEGAKILRSSCLQISGMELRFLTDRNVFNLI